MTTPSDDEILAAARDAGIILYRDVLGTERWRCDCIRTKLFALYRAAYAAGMEAAAVICDERKKRLLQWGLILAASEAGQAADAIRAANGREGKS